MTYCITFIGIFIIGIMAMHCTYTTQYHDIYHSLIRNPFDAVLQGHNLVLMLEQLRKSSRTAS